MIHAERVLVGPSSRLQRRSSVRRLPVNRPRDVLGRQDFEESWAWASHIDLRWSEAMVPTLAVVPPGIPTLLGAVRKNRCTQLGFPSRPLYTQHRNQQPCDGRCCHLAPSKASQPISNEGVPASGRRRSLLHLFVTGVTGTVVLKQESQARVSMLAAADGKCHCLAWLAVYEMCLSFLLLIFVASNSMSSSAWHSWPASCA